MPLISHVHAVKSIQCFTAISAAVRHFSLIGEIRQCRATIIVRPPSVPQVKTAVAANRLALVHIGVAEANDIT